MNPQFFLPFKVIVFQVPLRHQFHSGMDGLLNARSKAAFTKGFSEESGSRIVISDSPQKQFLYGKNQTGALITFAVLGYLG